MAEIDAFLRKGMEGILKLNDDCCFEVEKGEFSCGGSISLVEGYEGKLGHELFSIDLLITLYSNNGKQLFAERAEIVGMPHGTNDVVFQCEIVPNNKRKLKRVSYVQIGLSDEVATHLHRKRYGIE